MYTEEELTKAQEAVSDECAEEMLENRVQTTRSAHAELDKIRRKYWRL